MKRKLLIACAGAAVLGVAAAGAILAWGSRADRPAARPALPPATATVERSTLVDTTTEAGTLGYGPGPDVVSQLTGVVTGLPAVGQLIGQGEVPFAVSNNPVVLLYGTVPAYRDMPAGSSTADTTGPDIQQLNAALVALGYASADDVDPTSNTFDWNTKQAVRKLQDAHGVDDTGTLTLGSVVFVPGPVRVTATPKPLGALIASGDVVLTTSSTAPIVTVDVDPARQTEIHQGDTVTVNVPGGGAVEGEISQVGTVARAPDASGVAPDAGTGSAAADAQIEVTITIANQSALGSLTAAPVDVDFVSAERTDVLAVPVAALLALADGGYGVEIVDGATTRIVAVKTGMFASGEVEISGEGIAEGMTVGVPT